jgi:serine/threonine protein kinase
MGRVYLGRSAAARLVAVKTIRAEFAEEADFRTRFAHEVAAARRVSGAFTAPVVAADPEADVPWLATAYVPAPPLSTLIVQCGPLPVPAVRWLAAGCAEALESIHGVGLVHRDLKPSNVLVSPDGPRVIDFGVARAAERISLTMTRGAVGTPAYMAPEQARDTRRATTASDVYSLGATVLFAATGHGPYAGDSVMDVLVHLATEPPDLAGLPVELIEVVTACLEREPRRRPTSAAVLAHLAVDGADSADGTFGHAPLPAAAVSLLEAFRRDPRPADQPTQGADQDDTFGSIPEPGPPPRSARHSARQRTGTPRPASGSGRQAATGQAATGRGTAGQSAAGRGGLRRNPVLLGVAAAASALVLLGAGGAAGAYLVHRSPGSGGSPQAGTSSPAGVNQPGPGREPPIVTGSQVSKGKPRIGLYQPQGDPFTIFVVEGRNWPRDVMITLRLAGFRQPLGHVIADGAGSFNYAINQNLGYFPSGIPPGRYKVLVTAPTGAKATVSFIVIPPPGQGPPPGT